MRSALLSSTQSTAGRETDGCSQLAQRAGYRLNFARVASDKMMIATIHTASGISDTLHQVFERIVEKSQ